MGPSDERKGSARAQAGCSVIYLVAGARAVSQVLFSAIPFALCFGKDSSTKATAQMRMLFVLLCPKQMYLFKSCRL